MRLEDAVQAHRTGRMAEAEAMYRRLISSNACDARACHLLGTLLHETGRHRDALELLERSVRLAPRSAPFRVNLAGILGTLGRHAEAAHHAREAVTLNPRWPVAHDNLGVACEYMDELQPAVEHYRKALALDPSYADAHAHLGNALKKLGRTQEAVEAYRTAIQLNSSDGLAHHGLAGTLLDLGCQQEAIATYRTAAALRPSSAGAHSDLLHAMHYDAGCGPEALFKEARCWADRHARPLYGCVRRHPNDRSPNRRLRVGYVSPDFREHPVARFMEGVLENHDRATFETFCYGDGRRSDERTAALRSRADGWRETTPMPDEQVCEMVREDRIDILVDLCGHMGANRLLVFARKPAPVQVTLFGYPDTTGLDTIDWRITDPHSDPPGLSERYHAEQLFWLPCCAWCYKPTDSPTVGPLPALERGRVTFGCLNKPAKVGPQVVALWAQVLTAVPRSRLMLLSGCENGPDRYFIELFAEHGIGEDRLRFVGRCDRRQYLELFNQIDIALDPFPYNGAVTSCDALWMGVPLVTLAGSTYHSRQGQMLLSNVGLSSLSVPDRRQYVEAARRLSDDLPRLAQLRATLREQLRHSVLTDLRGYTRQLESAYRQMRHQWSQS